MNRPTHSLARPWLAAIAVLAGAASAGCSAESLRERDARSAHDAGEGSAVTGHHSRGVRRTLGWASVSVAVTMAGSAASV